jgi:hypothetical protein
MPQIGFELTVPVFERPKIVHALGRAATVIGLTTSVEVLNIPDTSDLQV